MNRALRLLAKELRRKQLKLALAESMTCGTATAKWAGYPGTSDFLAGSIICYSPEVKCKLMGISAGMIERHTSESKVVTRELCKKLAGLIEADVHAAITGLAAKGGSETKQKPVGTVYFCVRYKNKLHSQRKVFKGSPATVREKACDELFRMIKMVIE